MKKNTHSQALPEPVVDLLYQMLETELGGVEIYTTALKCVQNDDLREEWTKYLAETEEHVETVRELCGEFGLDPERDTPGRQVVRTIGKSLVQAMQLALGAANPKSAEIVATECVVLAETKDHLNWELLSKVAKQQRVDSEELREACARVEDEEDEHLYHSKGWTRELWLGALGFDAQLPPPEEEQDVKTAKEAADVAATRE